MKDIMKVYQVQSKVCARKEDTHNALAWWMEKAAAAGADLVALPEMFGCPYEAVNFPRYAEPVGGRLWRRCSELAQTYGLYLSAGSMPELGEGGKIYNTAYVFDRQGRQIARHRKMHLFDIDVDGGQRFRESDTLTAGNEVTVFDTEFGRLGLCICYDLRFPELARLMALEGACAVLVPAAFNMTTGPAHWELTFRARALDNQMFFLGTAPARERSASYHSWGHTIAVDPWGTVLNQLEEGEDAQLVILDLRKVRSVRRQLPLLRHRRTDCYELHRLDREQPLTEPTEGSEG